MLLVKALIMIKSEMNNYIFLLLLYLVKDIMFVKCCRQRGIVDYPRFTHRINGMDVKHLTFISVTI